MTEWRMCSSHGGGTSTGSQKSQRSSPELPPLLDVAQFPTSGMKNNHGHPSWWRRREAPECCCVRRFLLKGLLCLCCHIPKMNRWWWSVPAAIFPDSSSGITERRKHQTQLQRRLDDYMESVVRLMQRNFWFTKVHPFMSHLLFCSVNWLLLSLHSHKFEINKSRK